MTVGIAEKSCGLLTLQIGMPCQAHEIGSTCLATRSLGQNGINAHEIDRDGGQHVLHLRFMQAVIACASYSHPSYRLGKRPFDACSCLIRLSKCWSFLFLSPRLQGFMSRLWAHMYHPPGG